MLNCNNDNNDKKRNKNIELIFQFELSYYYVSKLIQMYNLVKFLFNIFKYIIIFLKVYEFFGYKLCFFVVLKYLFFFLVWNDNNVDFEDSFM